MIYCKNCGAENSKQGNFCKNCGQKLEWETIPPEKSQKPPMQPVVTDTYSEDTPIYREPVERIVAERHPGKKDKTVTVLIVVLTLLVAVLAGIVAWILLNDNNDKKSGQQTSPETEVVSDSGTTVEPEEKPFERISTYYPYYTYKDMNEIHNSTEASDEESYELEAVLEDYNDKWIDYVNYDDNDIFMYLREGTRAYNYAVNFGERDISESLIYMQVNDVRKTGNIYFVWSHEKIQTYSTIEGEKIKEYHWVYKIRKESGNFYVEDYTADPYYKN